MGAGLAPRLALAELVLILSSNIPSFRGWPHVKAVSAETFTRLLQDAFQADVVEEPLLDTTLDLQQLYDSISSLLRAPPRAHAIRLLCETKRAMRLPLLPNRPRRLRLETRLWMTLHPLASQRVK